MDVIEYPFASSCVKALKVGDMVAVTGRIFTVRDCVSRYLSSGGKPPVELKDGAIYHCGPIITGKDGDWKYVAGGPTTSMRVERYTPAIIEQCRVRVIIGKGGMGSATRKACAKYGCVYLHAVGGASAVLASAVRNVAGVHFLKEYGTAEAMWELDVAEMPVVVTIDASGRSLHERIDRSSRRVLKEMLAL